MTDEQEKPSPADPAPAPAQEPTQPSPPARRNRWGWHLLIGGLAIAGVLLALADIALNNPWFDPFAIAIGGGSSVTNSPGPGLPPETGRFDKSRFGQRFVIDAPFGRRAPISPVEALRAFLSNGAGLIFLALAALVLFPTRARVAVERLEGSYGPAVALAAGVAMFLLTLAAITLLRFTLIFLAVIPAVLVVALAAALFGIACISLGIGRLVQRRLRLAEAHPLIAALAGALVVFDVVVVPYAGVFALAAVAIAGLGLTVVTRFGSDSGWSFRDLNW